PGVSTPETLSDLELGSMAGPLTPGRDWAARLPALSPARRRGGAGRTPAAGLPGPGAERAHGAGRADRGARVAHLAAVRLDEMTEVGPLRTRHYVRQLRLHVVGIVGLRQAQALGDAEHVRVHRDAGHAEGVTQNDVGRLAPDARQRGQ